MKFYFRCSISFKSHNLPVFQSLLMYVVLLLVIRLPAIPQQSVERTSKDGFNSINKYFHCNWQHTNLNKFIETIQLLSHKTFFIEICINYDPTSFLPQFVRNFFFIFFFIIICKHKNIHEYFLMNFIKFTNSNNGGFKTQIKPKIYAIFM